ncbi:hypothetical protein CFP56_037928, partial [Quercus suber]
KQKATKCFLLKQTNNSSTSCFISPPVAGTIILVLKKRGTVGSFGNMYGSTENLSTTYLQPNLTIESHLEHKAYIFETGDVPLLLPDIESSSKSRKFYRAQSNLSFVPRFYDLQYRFGRPTKHKEYGLLYGRKSIMYLIHVSTLLYKGGFHICNIISL